VFCGRTSNNIFQIDIEFRVKNVALEKFYGLDFGRKVTATALAYVGYNISEK